MISSVEEALLMLNKWRSESAHVIAVGGFCLPNPGGSKYLAVAAMRFTGGISSIEDASRTFVLEAKEGADFLVLSMNGCHFGFAEDFNLPDTLSELIAENVDSFLALRFSNGVVITLVPAPKQI